MATASSKSSQYLVKMSPTVTGAVNALRPEKMVYSAEIVKKILDSHPEYGGKTAQETNKSIVDFIKKKSDEKGERYAVNRWIERVADLVQMEKIRYLHGRLLIIGLSLISPELNALLLKNNFVAKLISELETPLESVLSEEGSKLYHPSDGPAASGVNDYLDNKDDNPVSAEKDDFLDRYTFAAFLVTLLDQIPLTNGALAVHLYAPWGAGKTSFMNFMKSELEKKKLKTGESKWDVVDFNAWQNQSLSYPWWALMNNIFHQFKTKINRWSRIKEWAWRFQFVRLSQFLSLILIGGLFWFVLTPNHFSKGYSATLESIFKGFAAVLGLWGIFSSLTQSFFLRSPKAAQNYLDSKDNPMTDFTDKFTRLTKSMAPTNLVIFIDDLDRCKSGYVVDLLESIQNLFKQSNVLFVVAADMKWLNACYEVEYDKIKNYVAQEGKTIGPLFTEKMFQVSVALPGVPKNIKEKFWDAMLKVQSLSSPDNIQITNETKAETPVEESFEKVHATRIAAMNNLADKNVQIKTEHLLRRYNIFLDLNPRNMKRLLNAYTINKASSLISHIDFNPHQLILWTILNTQWPVLAGYLMKHPELVNPSCDEDFPDVPDNIMQLLQSDEVQTVIKSRGLNDDPLNDEALSKDTLVNCRILFSGSFYFPTEFAANVSNESKERKRNNRAEN